MSARAAARALTIAGSDSGGGAGIQADLKTFTALGVYGATAITAVTLQNTLGVFGVISLPPQDVARQMRLVLDDIGADAAKTGMLANVEIVEAVVHVLSDRPVKNLVVDPVMIAKSGDTLLTQSARDALAHLLLPLAHIVTPNLPEAEELAEMTIDSEEALREAARRIHGMGPDYVLMKGGHLEGPQAIDWLFDGRDWLEFSSPRFDTKNTHGTGCTFSAAITAGLAKGLPAEAAVDEAKSYLAGAIEHARPIGSGHGPLNHTWRIERSR